MEPWADFAIELHDLAYAGGLAYSGTDVHVRKALLVLGHCFDRLPISPSGFKLSVRSTVPVGRGLGSSAAFSVALSAALLAYTGQLSLCATGELSRDDKLRVFGMANSLEQQFHGTSSGVDPAASCFGGLFRYSTHGGVVGEIAHGRVRPYSLVMVDTNLQRSTRQVNEFLAKYEHDQPALFQECFEQVQALVERYYEQAVSLEEAVDENQQVLCKMGLSLPIIDEIVRAASRYGCHAKITGAGRGGCVLVVCAGGTVDVRFASAMHDMKCTVHSLAGAFGPGVRVSM